MQLGKYKRITMFIYKKKKKVWQYALIISVRFVTWLVWKFSWWKISSLNVSVSSCLASLFITDSFIRTFFFCVQISTDIYINVYDEFTRTHKRFASSYMSLHIEKVKSSIPRPDGDFGGFSSANLPKEISCLLKKIRFPSI